MIILISRDISNTIYDYNWLAGQLEYTRIRLRSADYAGDNLNCIRTRKLFERDIQYYVDMISSLHFDG